MGAFDDHFRLKTMRISKTFPPALLYEVVEGSEPGESLIIPGHMVVRVRTRGFYTKEFLPYSLAVTVPEFAAAAILISGGLEITNDPGLLLRGDIHPLVSPKGEIRAYYKGTETRIEGAYLL